MDAQEATDRMKHVLSQGRRGSIAIVYVFGQGLCAQVMEANRKVGPVIIPDRENGQTLADILGMLGQWAEGTVS